MAAMEQSLIEQYKDVYVFAQQVDNEISPIAFELLGKAKDLANDLNEKVVAVLLGHNVKDLAAQLGAYGADKVIVVDDPELNTAICDFVENRKKLRKPMHQSLSA